MISPARNGGRRPIQGIGLAFGIWIGSGLATVAHAGGRPGDGICWWGEYGYGPHFNHRGHGLNDFGRPFFTHGMGCGIPYQGPPPLRPSNPSGSGPGPFGQGDFGPYSGRTNFPDTIAPHDPIRSR